jgi:hypothetical protein
MSELHTEAATLLDTGCTFSYEPREREGAAAKLAASAGEFGSDSDRE